jgi:hypothetical protein
MGRIEHEDDAKASRQRQNPITRLRLGWPRFPDRLGFTKGLGIYVFGLLLQKTNLFTDYIQPSTAVPKHHGQSLGLS